MRGPLVAAVLLSLAGCAGDGTLYYVDTGFSPADRLDAGASTDRGVAMDSPTPRDTGTVVDPPRDTGTIINPPRDTGVISPSDTGLAATDRGSPTGAVPPDTVRFSGTLPTGRGRLTGRLTISGRVREMQVIRPSSAGARAPLMLLFHGTNTAVDEVIREARAQEFADRRGVVVIAPVALDQELSDWDHPDSFGLWWETYPSVNPDTNRDLLLVRSILVAAERDYGTDPDRVYIVGHSNGAFFAQLIAMRLNDRVAAWASSSGGLCNCATRPDCLFHGRGSSCAALRRLPGWCNCSGPDKPGPINTAGRRPPAYLTHGSADDIVTPYFTCALADRLAAVGYTTEVVIRDEEQHVMPDGFAELVWPFLSRYRRQ